MCARCDGDQRSILAVQPLPVRQRGVVTRGELRQRRVLVPVLAHGALHLVNSRGVDAACELVLFGVLRDEHAQAGVNGSRRQGGGGRVWGEDRV